MRIAIVGLLVLLGFPAAARSQTAPHNIEMNIRERWLHGSENPRFRPFDLREYTLYIDSIHDSPDGRTLDIRMNRMIAGGRIVQDDAGRMRELSVAALPPPERSVAMQDSFAIARFQWFERDMLSIPETRIWDVVPTHPPAGTGAGGQWADTLRLETMGGGNRQALSGVRTNTLLGDTVVAGHRLQLVQDSMAVHYEETALVDDRSLGTSVAVSRIVDGVMRGRHLYDPESGLFDTRADTTRLAGEAVLKLPDGRSFTTPARYERIRLLDRYDAEGWEARLAERRAQRNAERGGMVILAGDSIQQRLRRGDVATRDSLIDEWSRAEDPDRRLALRSFLLQWGGAGMRERILDLSLAAGDTAYAFEFPNPFIFRRLDSTALALLLPMLSDPGRAFGLGFYGGIYRSLPYERISGALLDNPPIITPDTADWGCPPEVCRFIASLADTASEPRIRDLGLLARFALDPVAYQDAIRARAAQGAVLLQSAAELLAGVGTSGPTMSSAPLPPAGADWRTWLEWMSGPNPGYPRPTSLRPPQRIRFGPAHERAIRFHGAVTGRDIIVEIQQRYETAQDSARLMFGTILANLDAMPTDTVALARRLQSQDPTEKQLAVTEFMRWFRNAGPVDPATAAELMNRAITNVMRDAPTDGSPVYIVGDSLPPTLREKWAARARIITSAQRGQLNPRERAFIVYPNPVRGIGSFVVTGASQTTVQTRAPEEAPRAYASGTTEFLLRTPDGWIVITSSMWIT